MWEWLQQTKYYVTQQTISSTRTATIGGIILAHKQYTHKNDFLVYLQQSLQIILTYLVECQISPYRYLFQDDTEKMVMDLLAMEYKREESAQIKEALMDILQHNPILEHH